MIVSNQRMRLWPKYGLVGTIGRAMELITNIKALMVILISLNHV